MAKLIAHVPIKITRSIISSRRSSIIRKPVRRHVSDQTPGVTAWKEHTTSFDRVQSVATTVSQPRSASYIADEAHVAENTARDHLDRLVSLTVLLTTERESGTVYAPDPLHTHGPTHPYRLQRSEANRHVGSSRLGRGRRRGLGRGIFKSVPSTTQPQMGLEQVAFWLIAVVILGAGLGVVLVREVWHATLLLGVALVSVAGQYALASAGLLAAVQVLAYVGGVLVLVAFAVMLTSDGETEARTERTRPELVGLDRALVPGVAAVAVFGLLAWVTVAGEFGAVAGFPETSLVADAGYALIGLPEEAGVPTEGFLVALVAIAVALDAALDGALLLADDESETGSETERRRP